MVLLRPRGARQQPSTRTVGATSFTRAMADQARKDGRTPRVEVWIQVRGRVRSVREIQRAAARKIAEIRRRGVPHDEQVLLLAEGLRGTDSREWQDEERFWAGAFDPEEVYLPEAGYLDRVKRETGASEVRAVVRQVPAGPAGERH